MTKAAYDKIAEGLQEALTVAKGEFTGTVVLENGETAHYHNGRLQQKSMTLHGAHVRNEADGIFFPAEEIADHTLPLHRLLPPDPIL